jgi:methylthioribose-1-phosphate isomerase
MRIAPEGTPAHNPAFDVTPADLITGIVTEEGVARPPYAASLREAVARRNARRGTDALLAVIGQGRGS